jgi:hypothetical protein
MVEESDTPGQGSRMGESDFLAERRARRATETGEAALTRRAEAAEATVKTLESHVTSLQARLQEAEEDRRRTTALLDVERTQGAERESELRRVKQREYAEQQLRVEAEDRLSGLEREGLRATSPETVAGISELSGRIEALQRQLSKAEQTAAAERASLRSAEADLQARVAGLERRAEEIQRGLVAERSARERSERELAGIREGHRRMEGLLGEIRALIGRLGTVLSAVRRAPEPPPQTAPPAPIPADRTPSGLPDAAAQQRGLEMADALAAAVERLRARALSAPPLPPEQEQEPDEPVGTGLAADAREQGRAPRPPSTESAAASEPAESETLNEPRASAADTEVAPAPSVESPVSPSGPDAASAPEAAAPLSETPVERSSQGDTQASAEPVVRSEHKHARSWLGRLRNRRKQRRGR